MFTRTQLWSLQDHLATHHILSKNNLPEDPGARELCLAILSDCANLTSVYDGLGVPEFELPESAYGSTGYLDNLKPEDMPSAVVKGWDRMNRRFIALRMGKGSIDREGNVREDRARVEVVFQRYTGDTRVWTSGGPIGLFNSAATDYDKAVLTELLLTGHAEGMNYISTDKLHSYDLM